MKVGEGVRRHFLAGGISLHLIAISLMAVPNTAGTLNKTAWQDPTVQAEFTRWAERLSFLGWDENVLEDHLWTFATGYNNARDLILYPFKPYYRYAGTWQTWKMFVAPHTNPTRMQIEIERGGAWDLAYRERSAEYTWLHEKFDHDRVRAMTFRIGWPQYQPLRKSFAEWVARQAAEFPDATRIRLSFLKEETLKAEDVRAGRVEPTKLILPVLAKVPR